MKNISIQSGHTVTPDRQRDIFTTNLSRDQEANMDNGCYQCSRPNLEMHILGYSSNSCHDEIRN